VDLEGLGRALGDRALAGEPMSRHTTFGIGGPADLFVVAHTVDELRRLVLLAHQHDVPFLILGEGANLLVADQGIRGLVIRNACKDIQDSSEDDGVRLVRADSGAELRAVAQFAIVRGLAGLSLRTGRSAGGPPVNCSLAIAPVPLRGAVETRRLPL